MTDHQDNQKRNEASKGVREDMEVVGKDGTYIGRIIEVRELDFLVDRSQAYDVYIPLEACQSVGNEVTINVSAAEVDEQGWSSPERVETPIIQDDLE